jgi:hypothetical protein
LGCGRDDTGFSFALSASAHIAHAVATMRAAQASEQKKVPKHAPVALTETVSWAKKLKLSAFWLDDATNGAVRP